MVKNYCNTGKAILYQNRVKTTIYTGILPVKYKDYFLENGIIKSQDILDSSKIDELLENKYSQYIPKESD